MSKGKKKKNRDQYGLNSEQESNRKCWRGSGPGQARPVAIVMTWLVLSTRWKTVEGPRQKNNVILLPFKTITVVNLWRTDYQQGGAKMETRRLYDYIFPSVSVLSSISRTDVKFYHTLNLTRLLMIIFLSLDLINKVNYSNRFPKKESILHS